MCSLKFLKDVLAKRKSLMKVSEITGIPEIPRIPDINAEMIWKDIKKKAQIIAYFPDSYVNSVRVPDRTHFLSSFICSFYLIPEFSSLVS